MKKMVLVPFLTSSDFSCRYNSRSKALRKIDSWAAAAAATEAAEAAAEEAKRKAEEEFKSELEDGR